MTAEAKKLFTEELANCKLILEGKTVNGVKLGDCGIDREWVESRIQSVQWILDNK